MVKTIRMPSPSTWKVFFSSPPIRLKSHPVNTSFPRLTLLIIRWPASLLPWHARIQTFQLSQWRDYLKCDSYRKRDDIHSESVTTLISKWGPTIVSTLIPENQRVDAWAPVGVFVLCSSLKHFTIISQCLLKPNDVKLRGLPCPVPIKVLLWSKHSVLFFLQILILRLFSLSASLGFHGPPLFTFKTDRLDFGGLDRG